MFQHKTLLLPFLLTVLAAAPAAAISPGGLLGPAATGATVTSSGSAFDTNADEGLLATTRFRNHDAIRCREAHRGFLSRNTVKPSKRRTAIAECGEKPVTDAVANRAN